MSLTKSVIGVLIALHTFLVVWATVGLIEWFWEATPWPRVSNSLFPKDILLMQWSSTLTAGIVFIVGYVLDWSYMPVALACVYAAMAALCAVETFWYMESETRFVAMVAEYFAYAAILVFLFRTSSFQPV